MTNFEVIIKEHPQFVKEVLAYNIDGEVLKSVIEGSHDEHYGCYSVSCDKREMDFLNKEYHTPVLDAVEKKYLSDVIRPFRSKIEYISKQHSFGEYYILIKLQKDHVCLPYFSGKSNMYKGMDIGTKYTLKDLGL
jgi:hypothetical protein